jgi:hypothetical protein
VSGKEVEMINSRKAKFISPEKPLAFLSHLFYNTRSSKAIAKLIFLKIWAVSIEDTMFHLEHIKAANPPLACGRAGTVVKKPSD